MANSKLIVVEGAQGAGKTTVTDYIRHTLKYTNLYRLSGTSDSTLAGKKKSEDMYKVLLDYIEKMENQSINLLFDRTFFTNEIYARLGYHNYDFSKTYKELLERLDNLSNLDKYDIYFVALYLEDEKLYEQRIKRDKHEYQKFEVQSSIDQQNAYLKMADEIEKECKNIKVLRFENSTEEVASKNVEKYFSDLM